MLAPGEAPKQALIAIGRQLELAFLVAEMLKAQLAEANAARAAAQ